MATKQESFLPAQDFPLQQVKHALASPVDCDDTLYLESIPGMIEKIRKGSDTSLSECAKISVTRKTLGLD